jgi:hypothetical protein
VTITATTAATATTILTLDSTTYDGSLVRFEFTASNCYVIPAGDNEGVYFHLWDDTSSADLGLLGNFNGAVAGKVFSMPVCVNSDGLEVSPAAGARVYSIRAWKSAAGDTTAVVAGAGGTGTAKPIQFTATYV